MLSGYDVSKSNEKKPVSKIQQALKRRVVSGCRVGMIAALGVALTAFSGATVAKTDPCLVDPLAEVLFSEDLAAVTLERPAFIDKTGKVVIDLAGFDNAEYFFISDFIWVKLGEKYGLIDKNGKVVIEPKFDEVRVLDNGVVAVKRSEKWGLVDKTGKMPVGMSDPGASFATAFVIAGIKRP